MKSLSMLGFGARAKKTIRPVQGREKLPSVNHKWLKYRMGGDSPRLIGIVFSMDRAAQLDALLASYEKNVTGPPLQVLYRSSTEEHDQAYQEVFRLHQGSIQHIETHESSDDFKEKLLGLLSGLNADVVFFLVDDNVFVEPVDVNELAKLVSSFSIPSLRLGRNIVQSYTMREMQPQPEFAVLETGGGFVDERLLTWVWSEGQIDWGYPLSLDGNLFMLPEILDMILASDFFAPNSLEAALQEFTPLTHNRVGICFEKSRLLNLPINRVQNEIENRHGDVHQDYLLQMWNEGLRIDTSRLQGVVNISAHQEMDLSFEQR